MRLPLGLLIVLGSAALAPAAPPRLGPAPWAENEALWFVETKEPQKAEGEEPGHGGLVVNEAKLAPHLLSASNGAIHVVSRGEDGGWVLRTHDIDTGMWDSRQGALGGSAEIRTMEVSEAMAPRTFRLRRTGSERESLSRYSATRVDSQLADGRTRTYEFQQGAFDRSEMPFVVRRLRIDVGETVPLNVFAGALGVYVAKATAVARETLTVPAGTFACVKIEVQDPEILTPAPDSEAPRGPADVSRRQYWISDDAHRYLVKQTEGRVTLELVRAASWPQPTAVHFADDGWDVGWTVPAGWLSLPPRSEDTWALTVPLVSGDAQVFCSCRFENFLRMLPEPPRGTPPGWRPEAPRRYVEREQKQRARLESRAYAVRVADSRDLVVGGVPAARAVADFSMATRASRRELVEYVQVVTQPIRATINCVVPKAEADARRPEIEALMDSLRLR